VEDSIDEARQLAVGHDTAERRVRRERHDPGGPAVVPPTLLPTPDLTSTSGISAVALAGLLVLAVTYTLYFARDLLIPLTAAMLAGYLLKPLIRILGRLGLPTMVATIVVFALFTGAVGGGAYLLTPPAARWVQNLPGNLDKAERRLRKVIRSVGDIRDAVDGVGGAPSPKVPGEPDVVTVARPALSARILEGAGVFVLGGGSAAFLLFFLLAAGEKFLLRAVSLSSTFGQKKQLVRISRGIERDLSRYMLARSLINAGLGIMVGAALWAIGVPNPILWGVAVAVLNFMPYVGVLVGVVLIGLVAIVSIDSLGRALLAPAAYVFLHLLEANVITPHVLGRSFSLNPIAVFGAVVFWGWLWGIPGALLAVPLLTAMSIVCANIDRLRPISVFLQA
jgi:predicted PurR-regulated permease PerM